MLLTYHDIIHFSLIGEVNVNRATDGDVVAVEILPDEPDAEEEIIDEDDKV